jgi:hypothetical protein
VNGPGIRPIETGLTVTNSWSIVALLLLQLLRRNDVPRGNTPNRLAGV